MTVKKEIVKCNKFNCNCRSTCLSNIDCRDSDAERWCVANPNGKEVTIVVFDDGREEIL